MAERPTLIKKQMEIAVLFDVVEIKIHCGDDYEAQVMYDDIVERMQSGQGITLGVLPQSK